MRKVLGAALLCALLLFPGGAARGEWNTGWLADGPLPSHPQLIDSALVRVVRQTKYADWTLYQPADPEIIGLDMTRDRRFKDRQFFPVVAMKEEQAVLILLQREGEGWRVAGVNETALNREGLRLGIFSIFATEQDQYATCVIRLGLFDDAYAHFSLWLEASTAGPTRFQFLEINDNNSSSFDAEPYFFADFADVGFDNELTYRYGFYDRHYAITRNAYPTGIFTDECKTDNFADFDLREVPLSVFDIMEEGVAAAGSGGWDGKVLLKLSASHDAETVCEVPEGARLSWVRPSAPFAERAWVLVAYGQAIGYLPRGNVR